MSIINRLTLTHIKENKRQTILTGISIATLVALLTAIALFVNSATHFLEQSTINQTGDWHAHTNVLSKTELDKLKAAQFISEDQTVYVHTNETVHYANSTITNVTNQIVSSASTQFVNELAQFRATGTLELSSDSQILISVGLAHQLIEKNSELTSEQSLLNKEITISNKTYTVKGIFVSDDPIIFTYSNQPTGEMGILFFKVSPLNNDLYTKLNNYKNAQATNIEFEYNDLLLSIYGVSDSDILAPIKSVAVVIVALLFFIAITVISSSFTLSLNERIKQIGALSSIGATRRQIRQLMLLEGIYIGVIATVIGLVIGLIGSAIAISLFNQVAQPILKITTGSAQFIFIPDWLTLIGVCGFSMVVVLLSALLPSLRAANRSAIENIKQVPFKPLLKLSNKPKKSRKSLLAKPFKTPGQLAHHYQKHNKSRSRVVFAVLTISLTAFITITNAVMLLTSSIQTVSTAFSDGFEGNITQKSTLVANTSGNNTSAYDYIQSIPEVDSVYSLQTAAFLTGQLNTNTNSQDERVFSIVTVSPQEEQQLLQLANVSKESFQTGGIIWTQDTVVYNENKQRGISEKLLGNTTIPLTIYATDYRQDTSSYSVAELPVLANISDRQLPFGVISPNTVFVSKDTFDKLITQSQIQELSTSYLTIGIHSNPDNNDKIQESVRSYDGTIFFNADPVSTKKIFASLFSMLQILVYGFLSLVSIMCLTTLFNTISSQIRLRRREFAILKSIGATNQQLRTMLSVENLRSGILSIVIANAISLALTYIIHTGIADNIINTAFNYPILPALISSLLLLTILLTFNHFSIKKVVSRSLVEDITNETL